MKLGRFGKSEALLICLIYSLAHGPLLLNQGIFFDDWVLWGMRFDLLEEVFKQAGAPWTGYFHGVMQSMPFTVVGYRLLVFLSYMTAALLLNSILRDVRELLPQSRIVVVVLFAVLPVNNARIAMINVPAVVSYFLFFAGFWMMSAFLKYRSISLRITSLVAFFISFILSSLLVFYFLVLLFLWYSDKQNLKSPRDWLGAGLKFADFLFLPILFFSAKLMFFPPHGLYPEYNAINAASLYQLIGTTILPKAFISFFVYDMNAILGQFSLVVLVGGALVFAIFRRYRNTMEMEQCYFYEFLGLGILAFFLAVFPYCAVGKLPQAADWDSRHQILMPLGASLSLFFASALVGKKVGWNHLMAMAILVVLSIFSNWKSYIDYEIDWYKQLALVEHLKGSSVVKEKSTFVVSDELASLDANGRKYRFYEYTGLMKYAFGDERRFSINLQEFSGSMKDYTPMLNEAYNLKDYKRTEPEILILIREGRKPLRRRDFFKLKYDEFFRPAKFRETVRLGLRLEMYDISDRERLKTTISKLYPMETVSQ